MLSVSGKLETLRIEGRGAVRFAVPFLTQNEKAKLAAMSKTDAEKTKHDVDIEKALILAQHQFANTLAPQMPVDLQVAHEHLTKFILDVSKDPRCNGLIMQLSICQPHRANDYVISLHLAKSKPDSQSAIDAIARKPTSSVDV